MEGYFSTGQSSQWAIVPMEEEEDQIEMNKMCGTCSMYGVRRGVYRVLVGKPEEKRPLGRLRRKRKDNIKMDLREVGCGAWTGLIWLRIGRGSGVL